MKTKQAVIRAKEDVVLEDREVDASNLAANELLIETERSFISAGTELANYTAADKNVHVPGSWCCYPWRPGYANVGKVLDAGERYRDLIGRRVYCHGPHAGLHRYGTNDRINLMAPVPDGLSSDEAAAARMAMVAMAGLDASKPQYYRWVAVFGLGMVGNLAAQLFRLTGAHVIGIDPSEKRCRLAKECGIPYTVSGTQEEVAAKVKEITGGKMAHVAVDAVGHSAIALQALKVTADGGEVIVLGSPRCEVAGDLTEVFGPAHFRWVTVKGSLEWNLPTDNPVAFAYSLKTRLEAVFGWVGDGRLKLKPLITHILPPEEIKTAYQGLLTRKDEYMGVVLKWK